MAEVIQPEMVRIKERYNIPNPNRMQKSLKTRTRHELNAIEMIIYKLLISCSFIIFLQWQTIDGKVKCVKCQGHQCRWRSSWKNCTGDACYLKNPGKHFKISHEHGLIKIKHSSSINKVPSIPSNSINKVQPITHKSIIHSTIKPTMPLKTKSTTKFHIPTKSTTSFKQPTKSTTDNFHILTKSTTESFISKKTTKLAHMPLLAISTSRVITKSTTKDNKPATAKKLSTKSHHHTLSHMKGSHSGKHKQRRSLDEELGCIQEKDISNLGCHNNMCVCIKDLCNSQPKIILNQILLFQMCIVALSFIMRSGMAHQMLL